MCKKTSYFVPPSIRAEEGLQIAVDKRSNRFMSLKVVALLSAEIENPKLGTVQQGRRPDSHKPHFVTRPIQQSNKRKTNNLRPTLPSGETNNIKHTSPSFILLNSWGFQYLFKHKSNLTVKRANSGKPPKEMNLSSIYLIKY
ncbi:hypothetical protein GQX74_000850 [Glossina fuscipes]|nr:hypothetical protein GQX74_000850 [Glossina fuscipes]